MMSGKDWAAFFHNIENKNGLRNLFANFIRKSYLRDISDVPVVIANNMETWFVNGQYVEKYSKETMKKLTPAWSYTLYTRILTP